MPTLPKVVLDGAWRESKNQTKKAGLHYNWHRHYDPSIGRYTQSDPLGFVDGPNVYVYARSNQLGIVDPNGRQAIEIIIGGAGAIGGGAAGAASPIPGGAVAGAAGGRFVRRASAFLGVKNKINIASQQPDTPCLAIETLSLRP